MKKTISLVLVLALGLASVSLAAEGTWKKKADLPTARMHLSTSVVNGKIYSIGGGPRAQVSVSTVEEYDPATDTWTTKSPMPTPRFALSTSVVNGKIYAIGGAGGGPPGLRTVEEYNPATDSWTQKANMLTPRFSFSTSAVNGKIYAMGGGVPAGSRVVEEYDPATDTWTRKASMPTGRYGVFTSVVNGKIYAVGGVVSFPTISSRVEEYDPVTDTWTRKADMLTSRAYSATSVVNGQIYAMGGAIVNPDNPPVPTVEVYDPVTDTWTRKADMPIPKTVFSTSVVNGKIYAIGGSGAGFPWSPALATVEEYDPNSFVVDFNKDEIVDCADICMMVDYWHTDESLYDIAPSPFGDGIVDVQDLIVLAEHLFEEILPFELVAYLKLDEVEGDITYDSAGSHNGILYGQPLWQPTDGQVAGALSFDGIDDYVCTFFVLSPDAGPFSVFAWIKGGAPGQVIISQTDGFDGNGKTWLGTRMPGGQLMSGLAPPPGGRSKGVPLESEAVITDGQWHHIGFVWDGSYRSLYVDAVEVAKVAAALLKSANGGVYIGAGKSLSADSLWSGLIDDVRIYSAALTPD